MAAKEDRVTQMSLDMPPVGSVAKPRERRGVAPLLKWPGGKSGELAQILAAMPQDYDRYCEPFFGGGAVFWSLAPGQGTLNDISSELMLLYGLVQRQDPELFEHLWALEEWWTASGRWVEAHAGDLVNAWASRHDSAAFGARVELLCRGRASEFAQLVPHAFAAARLDVERLAATTVATKLARMRKVELDRGVTLPIEDLWSNIEGAYKAVIYTALRSLYNLGRATGAATALQATLFFYLREYAYAAMFRFNARGEFNIPYGGISYNRKDLAHKIRRMQTPEVLSRLSGVSLTSVDFEECVEAFAPTADDFLFFDPPYDSDFSEYDLNPFNAPEHRRLGAMLERLTGRFMLVIKASPLIESLYPVDRFEVTAFDKTYMWTIKERNDRAATHLLITNYTPDLAPVDLALQLPGSALCSAA